MPKIKGAFLDGGRLKEGIFTLRTMDDAKQILKRVEKGKKAMIVGSGLIGMEMAEALSRRGMKTYASELMAHMLPGMIDEDIAAIVQRRAEGHSIPWLQMQL